MATELWIDDGDPWYMSPDIWVVPGTSPTDPVGTPTAGQQSYVWAKVHNRGSTAENNATVKYYWADPSTLVTRATATLIGQSYVSLVPGESKEVLCVTPWIPSWVNDGHECIICETFSPADPLPPHGENDSFNVRNDRHVAQRNLGVLMASASTGLSVYPFSAGNAANMASKEIRLSVKRIPLKHLTTLRSPLGLDRVHEEMSEIQEFGLVHYRSGGQLDDVGTKDLVIRAKPGFQFGLAFVVRLPKSRGEGSSALFAVEQMVEKKVVGGLGVLITHDAQESVRHHEKRKK